MYWDKEYAGSFPFALPVDMPCCHYHHQAKCISNRASKQHLAQLLNTHSLILVLQLTVERVEHCGPCAELITKGVFFPPPARTQYLHAQYLIAENVALAAMRKKDGYQFRSLHTRQHFSWYSEGTGQFLWSFEKALPRARKVCRPTRRYYTP